MCKCDARGGLAQRDSEPNGAPDSPICMTQHGSVTTAPRGAPAVQRWCLGLAAILLSALSLAICITEISITYALPNAIGHDTNEMAVAMSAVSGAAVLTAVGWLILAGRSTRWVRMMWAPMLLIVVSVFAVIVTFNYHAGYVY